MKTRQQTRLHDESNRAGELSDTTRPPADPEDDELVNLTPNGPPLRKRRVLGTLSKQTKPKVTNKIKGKLSGMFSLPIEVFIEIIRHLALPDLLSLSRSSKFFHQMLMTRSATTLGIWRTAVENVPGLPACPKDLCEPQYAALIYSKHCSMCGTSVTKPMNPYLNIRLCKDCIELHVTHVDDVELPLTDYYMEILLYQLTTTRMKATRYEAKTCLIRDVDKLRQRLAGLRNCAPYPDGGVQTEIRALIEVAENRVKYANSMDIFLRDMATTRTREIEQLKEQRRQEVRRRLEDDGWKEPDWTFPEFVARKWASLVDGPQALTERAWQKLYPRLVPYLEKNRESHQERSRMIRKGKRLRRIRRLLLGVRNATNLLEMDDEVILEFENPDSSSAGTTTTNDTITSTPSANEHEPVGTVDLDGESGNSNDPTTIVFSRNVQAPFPPMIDLLKWPIIVNLLEADTDLDTIQDAFEASKGEIEAQIRSWRSTVEKELVDTLKAGTTGEDQGTHLDTEIPPLQLPPKSRLMDDITPDTRLLLRADSVFCAPDDTVAPLPLHFPELFHILQDRPNDYFEVGFEECITYTIPKHGYTWDPSEVVSYPEGATAAKALLKELGRVDAAHFELQELGARFTCGSCADKRLRTWDEMVQHYVKALTHANIAQKATAPVTYNNVHSLDISDKPKGKRKPLVTLHSVEDAKELSSRHQQWQNLVRCNLCDQLGIEFQSVRDVMVKHVRTVHSVKKPKAEHYKRTGSYYIGGPNRINDPIGNISDSSKTTDQGMLNEIKSHSNHGQLGVHWSYYGSHSDLHPGWNEHDLL